MPSRNRRGNAAPDPKPAPTVDPYWKAAPAIDGGYGYGKVITLASGKEIDEFEINVHDDRADRGQQRRGIRIQVREVGKFGSKTVITMADLAEFDAFIEDMKAARKAMGR